MLGISQAYGKLRTDGADQTAASPYVKRPLGIVGDLEQGLPAHQIDIAPGLRQAYPHLAVSVELDRTPVGQGNLGAAADRGLVILAVVLRENGARRMLPQGMFRFEHPVHGTLDLFTVPIGPDGVGACYEIIFN